MLRKATIVSTISDEASIVIKKEVDGEIQELHTFPKGSIVVNENQEPSISIVRWGEIKNEDQGYKRGHMHLAIVTNADAGDIVWQNTGAMGATEEALDEAVVIIASTDKNLGLPRFTKSFLEKLIEKQNSLLNVFVDYEEKAGELFPRLDKKGNVRIKEFKDTWSTMEVVKLLKEYKTTKKADIGVTEEWLEAHK